MTWTCISSVFLLCRIDGVLVMVTFSAETYTVNSARPYMFFHSLILLCCWTMKYNFFYYFVQYTWPGTWDQHLSRRGYIFYSTSYIWTNPLCTFNWQHAGNLEIMLYYSCNNYAISGEFFQTNLSVWMLYNLLVVFLVLYILILNSVNSSLLWVLSECKSTLEGGIIEFLKLMRVRECNGGIN